MPLVLVAGISGSGKSTVCEELQRRGYEAHDIDLDGNAVWVDRESGDVLPGEASLRAESFAWFARHDWCAVPEKISAIASRADNRVVFVCGMVNNEHEILHLFSRVIYISIDAQTAGDRVATRTTNEFGKADHEMAAILAWLEPAEREHRETGAVLVDATQPLDQVVDDVLRAATDTPNVA